MNVSINPQLERTLLLEQLRAARRYGHTHDQRKTVSGPEEIRLVEGVSVKYLAYSFEDVDCELCKIENELTRLDELEGRDWRFYRDQMMDKGRV